MAREKLNNYLKLLDTISELESIIRIDDLFNSCETDRAQTAKKALDCLGDLLEDFKESAIAEMESEAAARLDQIRNPIPDEF